MPLDRRRFLAGGVGLALARPALAQPQERRLFLRNLHTEEVLDAVYWRQGRYIKAHWPTSAISRATTAAARSVP
jgi:uncharacterized protein YcbK (DUF882 family)